MFNQVKKIAAAVFAAVRPKALTVTKPVTTSTLKVVNNYGMQGSNYNPQQTAPVQSTAKVQTTAPASTFYGQPAQIQGTGTPPQNMTVDTASILAAQELARKRALAQTAFTDQKNWFQKALGTVSSAWHAPARYIGEWRSKSQTAKWLNDYTANANNQINAAVDAANARMGEAGKRLARGEITPEQYDALATGERNRIEKLADMYNNEVKESQQYIQSPTKGRAGNIVSSALGFMKNLGLDKVWRYTLGSGSENIPSLVNIPGRVANFFGNINTPGRTVWQEGGGNKTLQAGTANAWKATYNQRSLNLQPYTDKPFDKNTAYQELNQGKGWSSAKGFNIQQQWKKATTEAEKEALAQQWWSEKNAQGRNTNTIQDLLYDPSNWIGVGAATKAVAKMSWATKLSNWVKDVSASISKTKVGQGLSWLNKPIESSGQKWVNKLNKKMGGADDILKNFTDDEARLYQAFMLSKAPKSTWVKSLTPEQIKVVFQKALQDKELWQNVLGSEQKLGFGTKYRQGYMPTKTSPTDNGLSFLFKRRMGENKLTESMTGDWLNRGKTYRLWEHARALQDQGFSLDDLMNAGTKADKYGSLGSYKKAMEGLYNNPKLLNTPRYAKPTSRIAKGIFGAPTKIWKASVLPLRPAWYAYNAAWNLPASFMAGGRKTAGAYADILKSMVKERTFRPQMFNNLPKGVTGGLFGTSGTSALRKPGSWLEDFSRVAAYHGAERTGFSKGQALNRVNRYLFDYGNLRNWERPIKAVLPFWQFQKNINRVALQLPFTNPKASRVLHYMRQELVDKPLEKIPNETQSYTDPQTGEVTNYNPRESMGGRMWIPGLNKWVTTPFLPIMPEQLSQFGVNPWLGLLDSYIKNKDYFGNAVSDKSFTQNLANLFPQAKLGQTAWNAINKSTRKPTETWITESGYTKERQGYDPSKPNYSAAIDPTEVLKKTAKNFLGLGVLNGTNFDEKKWRANLNYAAFAKDYFGHDWYKEFPDYNARNAAQTANAAKYGYDLQKDLYDGKWSKYDSEHTAKVKSVKEATSALQNDVYKIYNELPKGTGDRSAFIKQWKALMADSDILDKYPNFMVFKNVNIAAKSTTSASGEKQISWSSGSTGSSSSTPKTYTRTPEQERKSKIAWAYQNLNPQVRKAWLTKQGLLDTSRDSWTDAQWEAWRVANNKTLADVRGMDFVNYPGLANLQMQQVEDLVKTFNPTRKATKKGVEWARAKSKAKTKRLTWKVA